MDDEAALYGIWVDDVSELQENKLLQLDAVIDEENPSCSDLAGSGSGTMLTYLRYFVGNQSIQGCADVAHLCNSLTKLPEYAGDGGVGVAVRMLCSETCQCKQPGGSQIAVQGCPYGTNSQTPRPCQKTPEYSVYRYNGVCIEKSAEVMRNNSEWTSWVNTIRDYAQSSADFARQAEAALIAEAMWDHGCGFIANLTGQNISWGTCWQWNSGFDWQFKTVEVFCPITCGCGWSNLWSNCPLPYGRSCEDIQWGQECATVNDQHYCMPELPGIDAEFYLTLATTNYTVIDQEYPYFTEAFQETLIEFAGNGLTKDRIFHYYVVPFSGARRLANATEPNPGEIGESPMLEAEEHQRRLQVPAPATTLQGKYRIIQIEASMDIPAMAQAIFINRPVSDWTTAVQAKLTAWGRPVDELYPDFLHMIWNNQYDGDEDDKRGL